MAGGLDPPHLIEPRRHHSLIHINLYLFLFHQKVDRLIFSLERAWRLKSYKKKYPLFLLKLDESQTIGSEEESKLLGKYKELTDEQIDKAILDGLASIRYQFCSKISRCSFGLIRFTLTVQLL